MFQLRQRKPDDQDRPNVESSGRHRGHGGIGHGPAIINGSAWIAVQKVSAAAPDRIVRIGSDTNAVDLIVQPTAVFGGGGHLALAGGSVWVSDGFDNKVFRLPMSAFTR